MIWGILWLSILDWKSFNISANRFLWRVFSARTSSLVDERCPVTSSYCISRVLAFTVMKIKHSMSNRTEYICRVCLEKFCGIRMKIVKVNEKDSRETLCDLGTAFSYILYWNQRASASRTDARFFFKFKWIKMKSWLLFGNYTFIFPSRRHWHNF